MLHLPQKRVNSSFVTHRNVPHMTSALSDVRFILNSNSFYHFPTIRMIGNKYLPLYHRYIKLRKKRNIIWPNF